jgi:hypothetical protein
MELAAVLSLPVLPWRRAVCAVAVAACAAGAALLAPASAEAAVVTRATPSVSAARGSRTAKLARRRAARRATTRRSAARGKATRSKAVRRTVVRGSALLRGSPDAVDRAYQAAKREGLDFEPSRRAVERGAAEGEYVRLPRSSASFRLRGVAMPYARPETRDFLLTFAPRYRRACGEPLTVTSAMRPTSVRLANSVEKTVHPTGMALDLRTPRNGCRAWMRSALVGYERSGIVEATEEHHPAHFHVAVLRAP